MEIPCILLDFVDNSVESVYNWMNIYKFRQDFANKVRIATSYAEDNKINK